MASDTGVARSGACARSGSRPTAHLCDVLGHLRGLVGRGLADVPDAALPLTTGVAASRSGSRRAVRSSWRDRSGLRTTIDSA